MTNKTEELKEELKEYPEDDVVRAELKGRQEAIKEVEELVDERIDHYEPYRPILDSLKSKEISLKSKEIRKVLRELKQKIKEKLNDKQN